jgi:hypothetical protein
MEVLQMAKQDDFELRVVEVSKPLPDQPSLRPLPKQRRRPAPTPAEALEAFRATKGAEALIERIAVLDTPWEQVAHWDVSGASGAALGGAAILWGCDFPGSIWNMLDGYTNNIAYFAGDENLGGMTKPNALDGKIWCYMQAPSDGYYMYVAQLLTYLDQYYAPGYYAAVTFSIDSYPLGTRTLYPGTLYNLVSVVNLCAGLHRFEINQSVGGVFFEGLTAYQSIVYSKGITTTDGNNNGIRLD